MRLLLIDDDEVDREAIVRALGQSVHRFHVTEANCAKEGLDMAARRHFDGILLDYLLPDANGLEVLTHLNRTSLDQTAVVMISRYEDERLAERCIELGAQDFLLKDEVTSGRLTRSIRNAKQRSAMAQALRISHEKLKELAEHDSLTKLVNRYGFELCLNRALSQVKRQRDMLAVILLDLDDFKGINDTLGHQMGDILLVEVASRLSKVVRESDLIARIGGDEFVVLVTEQEGRYFPLSLAKRLLKAFEDSFHIGETEIMISASLGIAMYGESADSASELLKCADIAMYRAKKLGRNQAQFYSEELDREVRQRNRIEQGLKKAIKNNELRLYYQGKFDAVSGRLMGMEALLRWMHPEDGLLGPDAFLPVAEEIGMMEDIGNWVLYTALKQTRTWQLLLADSGQALPVAINLSASQIGGESLSDKIKGALDLSGLPPQLLELEITENALIEEPKQLARELEQVVALGVTLALDDFGTGFSSLEHLRHFPIQVLKIDKSFVATVGKDDKGCRLLSALINFARGFDVIAVAEGIETEEQAKFCRDRGCDLLQGYLYSKPLTVEEFEQNLIRPLLSQSRH
ncbi:putative bifunctional diguanylate cyclase/phosphodiesterase [Shewanella cyperi]|uniref:putative bifunctional diguanylate cyclase/phosphodiesterase n=1 Tax=Shewanella cyperi TaxID=2814292 RepID=UPI001A952B01|nr:GGDEF domain-containing response regulator [Shewanella cyperi]QSX40383.1 EAL domain-containing protein [Shewanella cyperi]